MLVISKISEFLKFISSGVKWIGTYQILLEIYVQSNVNMMDFYLSFSLVDLACLFSWMPRVTWKKILWMFYNILTCNAPKNFKIPIFNSCLTPSNLHFCALRKRKLKKMECKKFLSFSHLPRDHHVQVQGHHEVFFIYIHCGW